MDLLSNLVGPPFSWSRLRVQNAVGCPSHSPGPFDPLVLYDLQHQTVRYRRTPDV